MQQKVVVFAFRLEFELLQGTEDSCNRSAFYFAPPSPLPLNLSSSRAQRAHATEVLFLPFFFSPLNLSFSRARRAHATEVIFI